MRPLAISLLACLAALLSASPGSVGASADYYAAPACVPVVMETMPLEEMLMLDPAWMLPSSPEERVREYLKRSPWPRWLHAQALAVIACESTYNPNGVGDDGLALGLFQVRTDYHPKLSRLDLFDPQENLLAGYIIWLEAGRSWNPWTCQP
jgi:hypothetical protein